MAPSADSSTEVDRGVSVGDGGFHMVASEGRLTGWQAGGLTDDSFVT